MVLVTKIGLIQNQVMLTKYMGSGRIHRILLVNIVYQLVFIEGNAASTELHESSHQKHGISLYKNTTKSWLGRE